jgi:hypothetical protein
MRPSYRNENRERSEEGRQPARLALFAGLGLICHLLIFLSLFLTYIEYFNIYSATDRGSPVEPIPNTGWQLLSEAFQPQTPQRVADMGSPPLAAPLAVVLLVALILPALIYLALLLLLPISVTWKTPPLRRGLVLGSWLNFIGLSLSGLWLLSSNRPEDLHGPYQNVDLAFAIPPAAFLLSLICCGLLLGYLPRLTENGTRRV